LDIAGRGAAIHRKVGKYSHGMKQRLAVAQAMLGLPELLVLDEPTDGLDPPQIREMRRGVAGAAHRGPGGGPCGAGRGGGTGGRGPPQIAEMRRVLQRYATGGRAVLVSSHLLAEVEQTCTHVIVMHKGVVVASGQVQEIVGDTPTTVIEVSDVDLAS